MEHMPEHSSHFLAPRTCRACRVELSAIAAIYVLCWLLITAFFAL